MICDSCGKVTAENDALRQEVRSLNQVIDDLKAEKERLRQLQDAICCSAVKVVKSCLCEKHQGVVEQQSFQEFEARQAELGCIECLGAENERLRRFIAESSTTFYPCKVCGHSRTPKQCLWCEIDRLKRIIAKHRDADRPRSRVQCSVCGEFYDPGEKCWKCEAMRLEKENGGLLIGARLAQTAYDRALNQLRESQKECAKHPGPMLLRAIREGNNWVEMSVKSGRPTKSNWQEIVRLAEQCEKEEVFCAWTVDAEGTWSSSCGQEYVFTNDEGPVGNGFKFCHHCGNPLVEKEQQ